KAQDRRTSICTPHEAPSRPEAMWSAQRLCAAHQFPKAALSKPDNDAADTSGYDLLLLFSYILPGLHQPISCGKVTPAVEVVANEPSHLYSATLEAMKRRKDSIPSRRGRPDASSAMPMTRTAPL